MEELKDKLVKLLEDQSISLSEKQNIQKVIDDINKLSKNIIDKIKIVNTSK